MENNKPTFLDVERIGNAHVDFVALLNGCKLSSEVKVNAVERFNEMTIEYVYPEQVDVRIKQLGDMIKERLESVGKKWENRSYINPKEYRNDMIDARESLKPIFEERSRIIAMQIGKIVITLKPNEHETNESRIKNNRKSID